ncbi:hypothetical protein SAMN05443287_11357 [Micromonospora phaseoli]|uniref:Uncharacterized protein n=1 Tax=Micromonospora phaseoli TaxID=1144548 RepID=A0A1H7DEK2_9ACTN|nr:hypothetical protein [Micromonospora phaseoli]PZV90540.1 hypothetical protein CLV64_11380 [Micromonospora phaseoli]GIJ78069.1 hypothetical protein Xph01_25010 [Micromonospora phaseoli]SEJ99764.1 hypothetical protein SAMN05443287_11357 [Micromonospora phaseoli]
MAAPTRTRSPWRSTPAAVIAAGWFSAALAASALGAFRTPPGEPPVVLALAAGAPPLVVLILGLRSSRFRAWARGIDLRFLTLLQTWRVAGLAFLALAAVDALPAGFALPAGLGDVAIGLTAPLVALFVVDRADRLFVVWTAVGIADLLLAVALGVLYSASPAGVLLADVDTGLMSTLPMSLVPAFGVPVTLVAHLLSLINLTDR